MADTDRIEQLRQRQRDLVKIGFVVAHADVVIGIAADGTDLDVVVSADLIALARSADGRPQGCKTGAEHDDKRHVRLLYFPEQSRGLPAPAI